MSIRLVIVGKITPSLNVLMRAHIWGRKREGAEWAARILVAARHAGRDAISDLAQGKRRLTIERHAKRLIDTDNLAGAKDLIDQIRRLGLIRDDKPELCELRLTQEKIRPGEQQHMVILLEDIQ